MPRSDKKEEDSEALSGAMLGDRLNSVTLSFRDPALERRFNIDHLIQALPILRASIAGAALTYGSFCFLDPWIIPEAQILALWIRFAVVVPILVGIVLLSYSKSFPRLAQMALSSAMLVSGLGIITMVAAAGEPGRSVYYAGMILVIIIGSSLVPIRWMAVALVCAILFVAYQFVALEINPLPSQMLLNNDFFLFASVVAGIGASYLQELKIRRIFIRDEGLRLAREQSDELRVRAEAANRAKSEFLAVMSHELRTPLNAILGFTEIMQLRIFGPLGSERYATYADDIHHSAQHLLSIVTDILDLSKAEVGKLTIEDSEVVVVPVLDQCLRLLREWAAGEGLRLSLDVASGNGPVIRADERLVKQVFLNILGNAIKFTPSGGSIVASLAIEEDGRLLVRFRDSGIGIAEADLDGVLQPFVQVESAFARAHGGAGLGLPLVKKIAELHGGGVGIASTLGVGTTVTVWFPAERVLSSPHTADDQATPLGEPRRA